MAAVVRAAAGDDGGMMAGLLCCCHKQIIYCMPPCLWHLSKFKGCACYETSSNSNYHTHIQIAQNTFIICCFVGPCMHHVLVYIITSMFMLAIAGIGQHLQCKPLGPAATAASPGSSSSSRNCRSRNHRASAAAAATVSRCFAAAAGWINS